MQIYNRQLKVIITNKLNDLQNTTQKTKDPAARTKNSWNYLNKIEKNQNKTSMAKAMGASEIHRPRLALPGPGSMYRLKPPHYLPNKRCAFNL
jgi:hypothetical protein